MALGWAAALAATLLVSFALATPTSAPGAAVASASVSPSAPVATQPPPDSSVLPDAGLLDIPRLPPGGGGSGSASARRQPLPDAVAAEVSQALDRARETYGLDVLALGIRVGNGSWTGVSGVARDGVTALDGDSPFGIASITKTFTASLVLQLVEEGSLALDDNVSQLLPELGLTAGVTVEQLLSHTSGIADLLAPMRDLMRADPGRIWTAQEVLAQVGPPRFAPGTDFAYSNTNYVILGLLIERVTGDAFADQLDSRILDPLGLDGTGILTQDGAPPLMPLSWASAFGPSGFMYSDVSDLLDWSDALYGGQLLRRSSLVRMLTFNEDDYGLGAQRIELDGRIGYGHSGLLQSFTSLLVQLPGEDVTISLIGTWQGFEPVALLTRRVDGQASILDVALAAAGVTAPTPGPS
jgi:D-alanyl-D-alanine carboxypeptidase